MSEEFEHKVEYQVDDEGVSFHTFIAPGFLLTFRLNVEGLDNLCAAWDTVKQRHALNEFTNFEKETPS